MPGPEPGTYRLTNVRDRTAITIPGHHPSLIVGWQTPNEPNQKWFIRRSGSGNGYHIQDCMFGRYIALDGARVGARAYLERYPTEWQLDLLHENVYLIKLADHDLVLDSHGGQNGASIHAWPRNKTESQKQWRLEKLSQLTGEESELARFGITGTELLAVRMLDQVAEKDKQLAKQAEELEMQRQKLAKQAEEIEEQRRQIQAKDLELVRLEEALSSQQGRAHHQGSAATLNEVMMLRDKFEQSENLMIQASLRL